MLTVRVINTYHNNIHNKMSRRKVFDPLEDLLMFHPTCYKSPSQLTGSAPNKPRVW